MAHSVCSLRCGFGLLSGQSGDNRARDTVANDQQRSSATHQIFLRDGLPYVFQVSSLDGYTAASCCLGPACYDASSFHLSAVRWLDGRSPR